MIAAILQCVYNMRCKQISIKWRFERWKTNPESLVTNRKLDMIIMYWETFEAGIAFWWERRLNRCREGKGNLKKTVLRKLKTVNCFYIICISPYEKGNIFNRDPLRTRKLLMHKKQINRLAGQVQEKGLTLIPLKVYLNERGLVKVELALAKGKAIYDKREDIKRRDASAKLKRHLRITIRCSILHIY